MIWSLSSVHSMCKMFHITSLYALILDQEGIPNYLWCHYFCLFACLLNPLFSTTLQHQTPQWSSDIPIFELSLFENCSVESHFQIIRFGQPVFKMTVVEQKRVSVMTWEWNSTVSCLSPQLFSLQWVQVCFQQWTMKIKQKISCSIFSWSLMNAFH